MEIIYKSIGDLPINRYLELQKVLSNRSTDPNEDDIDLNVKMLSIFTGESVEDIYNSSLVNIGISMSDLRNALDRVERFIKTLKK